MECFTADFSQILGAAIKFYPFSLSRHTENLNHFIGFNFISILISISFQFHFKPFQASFFKCLNFLRSSAIKHSRTR